MSGSCPSPPLDCYQLANVTLGLRPGSENYDKPDLAAIDIGLPELAEAWAAIAATRPTVSAEGNSLIVAQYRGPRLPEGATTLPDGAVIEYWDMYPA